MQIIEADVWVESEAEAMQELHLPLSQDHPDLICVSVSREQEPPSEQPLPDKRPDPRNPNWPMIQDPAPAPLPGKVRFRLHYKAEKK